MTAQWLLGWWNLIFLVPFGLALVYLGLYTLTGLSFGDADADADVNADVGADAEVDMDADADAGADADASPDADADAESDGAHEPPGSGAHAPWHLALLSFFGIGRVPLGIVLPVALFAWGAVGFVTNAGLRDAGPDGSRAALVSLLVAAVGSLLAVRGVAAVVGRLLPPGQSFARRRHELLGHTGEAIYPIDGRFGMAAVRDERGNLFHVPCRVGAGHDAVAKGGRVTLVGYSAKKQIYQVVAGAPAELAPPAMSTPPRR